MVLIFGVTQSYSGLRCLLLIERANVSWNTNI